VLIALTCGAQQHTSRYGHARLRGKREPLVRVRRAAERLERADDATTSRMSHVAWGAAGDAKVSAEQTLRTETRATPSTAASHEHLTADGHVDELTQARRWHACAELTDASSNSQARKLHLHLRPSSASLRKAMPFAATAPRSAASGGSWNSERMQACPAACALPRAAVRPFLLPRKAASRKMRRSADLPNLPHMGRSRPLHRVSCCLRLPRVAWR
jgi:hypothetical protein